MKLNKHYAAVSFLNYLLTSKSNYIIVGFPL